MTKDLNFGNGHPKHKRKLVEIKLPHTKHYFIIGIKKLSKTGKTIEKVLGSGADFAELSTKIKALEKSSEYGPLRVLEGTAIIANRVY